jgi:hypothetical protein
MLGAWPGNSKSACRSRRFECGKTTRDSTRCKPSSSNSRTIECNSADWTGPWFRWTPRCRRTQYNASAARRGYRHLPKSLRFAQERGIRKSEVGSGKWEVRRAKVPLIQRHGSQSPKEGGERTGSREEAWGKSHASTRARVAPIRAGKPVPFLPGIGTFSQGNCLTVCAKRFGSRQCQGSHERKAAAVVRRLHLTSDVR